jgi:peptide/nickel transport system substrate-binding protein
VTLEAGGVDWLSGVSGQNALSLMAEPAYQVLRTGSGGTFCYLGLNVQAPVLADKRVRQAFGYAIDRQRLVDIAFSGFGRPASIPWPQQSPAYDATLDATYTYDPAHARQLLDAAGWDAGTVLPISVPTGLQLYAQLAQIIQANLANIGVQATLQTLDLPDYVVRLQQAQFDGAWISNIMFMNLSPVTFFETSLTVRVPNISNFVSQQYQDLINQTFAATDEQSLHQGLHDLTTILLDESFAVMIAESDGQQTGLEIARAGVRDIAWDRFGGFAYQNVWLG